MRLCSQVIVFILLFASFSVQDDIPKLILAVMSKNVDAIEQHIREGADVNTRIKDGSTALHVAVWSKNKQTVSKLLVHGADVDAKTAVGQTPLHTAVNTEDREIVSLLLEHGANVNAQDTDGTSPLMIAARRNQIDIVRVLLAAGADVNQMNTAGLSALPYAKVPEIRAILLEWANPEQKQKLKPSLNEEPSAELLKRKPLVSSWTEDDVQTFLTLQGIHPDQLKLYQEAFKDHKVDGHKLLSLDDKYLREQMKLYVPGWRALVSKSIAALKSNPAGTPKLKEAAQEAARKLKDIVM